MQWKGYIDVKVSREATYANEEPLCLRTFNIHGILPLHKMFLIVEIGYLYDLNAPRTKNKWFYTEKIKAP